MVASLLAFAILIGVSGIRQPGGVREPDHALRAERSGAATCAPGEPVSIGNEHDDPWPRTASRGEEPARKRPRSGPSALSEPAGRVALQAPAADAHLLADGDPVPACGRDVVADLRGRAPPNV